jgi:hypothetical protein
MLKDAKIITDYKNKLIFFDTSKEMTKALKDIEKQNIIIISVNKHNLSIKTGAVA